VDVSTSVQLQSLKPLPKYSTLKMLTPLLCFILNYLIFSDQRNSQDDIFVTSENSHQMMMMVFLCELYDGPPKEYPNGVILMFFCLPKAL
jgi:hypothetical protein